MLAPNIANGFTETQSPSKYKTLSAKVLNRATDILIEDWQRIYPQVLENHFFFKTLDECEFKQFEFFYIAIYEEESLIGLAPCFLMHYPLDTTIQGPFKAIILQLKKFFPHFLEFRALVCGLPMGQGRIGMLDDSHAILKAIHIALESLAESRGISVVAFKDFDSSYCSWFDPLQAQGYYKFESLPSTEMDVRFNSFDQYLKTLSRVSRDGLKRKFKKPEQASIAMEVKRNLEEDELDAVYTLYRQTLNKHEELSFEIMPKMFFQSISENMSNKALYFLWRLDDRVVAFALCFISEERLIDYYLGFDYSVAYDYHLYFIRFRDLLNWCIAHKIPKYEMGNTGYETKRRLGFQLIRLFGYVRHRNPLVNPFFHLICKILRPENFDDVFKQIRRDEQTQQFHI